MTDIKAQAMEEAERRFPHSGEQIDWVMTNICHEKFREGAIFGYNANRWILEVTEDTSDGYHTFKELYEFRKVYNAALFNTWSAMGLYDIHKSYKHHDGELCFGGGWFIVVAILPTGQISNHYKSEDWELFKCKETETALYEFDGHTSQDVINRLLATNPTTWIPVSPETMPKEEIEELKAEVERLKEFIKGLPFFNEQP